MDNAGFLKMVAALAALLIVRPAYAATYTVVNSNNIGAGSLSQAILDANANPGLDTIAFNIPGPGPHTIQPAGPLPPISDPVIIDGYTQPGASPATVNNPATLKIELDGSAAVMVIMGLVVSNGNSTVRGLVINRFGDAGIILLGSGGNTIEGNHIGTDVTGTIALGNMNNGVIIFDSADNLIGGTTPAARNVISGNNPTAIAMRESGATGNKVQGNYIGTDSTGTAPLGNGVGMAFGFDANNNTIGGTTVGARNIISGNINAGLVLGLFGTDAPENLVQGNYIGTDVTGTVAMENGVGIYIKDATNNTIGGTIAEARNVISGNNWSNVVISGSQATGNLLQGNYIGTDVAGTVALGNLGDGVGIDNASGNIIGGTEEGAGNLISGNGDEGIDIEGSGATGNLIQGNYIGTDVTGTAALGNVSEGVSMDSDAYNNTIGGTTPGARNIISGNEGSGVNIGEPGSTGNVVQGNYIGTDFTGTYNLGNAACGVSMEECSDNTIGGTASGAGNTIAFNGEAGVCVEFGTGNAILSNSIFSNAALGIDLGYDGVTPNDPDDPDDGTNRFQNFPEISGVTMIGEDLQVGYTVPSIEPNSAYPLRVEFFRADDGEGKEFLGYDTYSSPEKGIARFTPAVPINEGDWIVATATDEDGNSSEFSEPFQYPCGLTVELSVVEASPGMDVRIDGCYPPYPEQRIDIYLLVLTPVEDIYSILQGGIYLKGIFPYHQDLSNPVDCVCETLHTQRVCEGATAGTYIVALIVMPADVDISINETLGYDWKEITVIK